ncbi:MAG: hypothetical protein D6758_12485 [Gammaproteobacteria bacterium]|nr:MAG: hypothetical protein D6758_12485 [Gammaproteobacteria bacterium]
MTVAGQRKRLLISLVLACTLLTGCATSTRWLFYPDSRYYQLPDRLGIPYRTVYLFPEPEITLVNWWLAPDNASCGTVLFLHGNGENLSTHMNSVAWLTQQGWSVFLLDYRGYMAARRVLPPWKPHWRTCMRPITGSVHTQRARWYCSGRVWAVRWPLTTCPGRN